MLLFQGTTQQKVLNLQDGANAGQQLQGLTIERNKISLSDVRSINVDSSRLSKPKIVYKPIVKTIPTIPLSDSISHPEFKSLSGKYYFPEKTDDSPIWYNEYTPLSSKDIENSIESSFSNKKLIPEVKEIAHTISEGIIIINTDKQKGFANTEWMLGIIILCLIIFGWIKVGFGRFINTIIQSSYNYHAARRMQEEPNALRKRVFYFMNSLFFIVLPLFTAQWLIYNNILIFELTGIALFLLSLLFWIVIYSVKSFALIFLDYVFVGNGAFVNYNSTVFIYNKLLSFCLLPIVSVLPFVPQNIVPIAFNVGFFLIVIFYLMRIFRGMLISIKNRISIFYLFLYLCALEILPMLVLFKLISGLI